MIKVEVLKQNDDETSLYFTSSNNSKDDIDTLDELLKLIVGPFPRRGGFPVGLPAHTLKVEINTKG